MTQHLSERALSRRSLLKRGAAVGAGTVWIVPAVQAFSMTSANAAEPSGAPTTPPGGAGGTTAPGGSNGSAPAGSSDSSGIDAVTITKGSGPRDGGGSGIDGQSASRSSGQGLAATGPAVPVGEALKYGVGAVAIGAAALAAGRRRPSPTAGPRHSA